MYAVQIKPGHAPQIVTTGMFGGKGAVSVTRAKARIWKTEKAAQKFASALHVSQNATVVKF